MTTTRSYLRERIAAASRVQSNPPPGQPAEEASVSYLQRRMGEAISSAPEVQARYIRLRDQVRDQLLREIDVSQLFSAGDRTQVQAIRACIQSAVERHEMDLPASALQATVERLMHDLVGFGPIQPLIDDPTVSEVLVNRWDDVWVERHGRLEPALHIRFESDDAVREMCERIALPLRRRIDDRVPIMDARLPDGSRVCATLSPPALDGCAMAIRKFNQSMMGVDALKAAGALSGEVLFFLERAVRARCSLLVVGGTSSGKTTMLNALSSLIPGEERVITIEDSAELQLQQPHVLRYETRQGNSEGRGEISIRDLVRTALRLRPDRIVVGEVRGAEALDMIQANNTGHDGGFSTLHANTARDALSRLETMVLTADSGLPLAAIRQQIASAFHIIISCIRLRNGKRRVSEVLEVSGVSGMEYMLRPLWRYDYGLDSLVQLAAPSEGLSERLALADGEG